jgi:hypothetical protein
MTEQKKASKRRPRRRFKVILLIVHPTIDPRRISNELGLKPYVSFRKGHPATAPSGHVLPHLPLESRWNHIYKFNGPKHALATSVERLLDSLASHRSFFQRMCRQGGSTQLYVQMPGDVNNGSTFPWELLKKLSDIRIGLGIEVFPNSPDPL